MDGKIIAIERIKEAKENKCRYLDLSGLFLTELPLDISDMDYLFDIDLSYNSISKFPEEISCLSNIQYLNLSNNYLQELYLLDGLYYSYKEIDISNNNFNFIPESITELPEETKIIFHNNPFLNNLPVEIYERKDIFYIKFYLDSLKNVDYRKRLFETKLLIVGKGDVGKTTLMKTLMNPSRFFKIGEERSTDGINIEPINFIAYFPAIKPYYSREDYESLCILNRIEEVDLVENEYGEYEEKKTVQDYYTPISEFYTHFDFDNDVLGLRFDNQPQDIIPDSFFSKEIKINIWDFGGQEILYGTHQFFLTQRSVYVFVWDSRPDNEEESFEYWLNVIQRLSNNSPVIVVMNKVDAGIKNIDEISYKEQFENIIGFYRVSCFTKEGIFDLKDKIIKTISELPHISDRLPISWDTIRNKIKNHKKDFISYGEFKEICNLKDEKSSKFLSTYLNDLGDIVHFVNDYTLRDLVIINPYWLTEAIYALIHSLEIQKNNGLFDVNDLPKLLDSNKYPPENYHKILLLMEKFEICFKVIGSSNLYVIPTLLKAMPDKTSLKEEFVVPESLKFEIAYNFLPSGIIERLICRLKGYLRENDFWKYGAVFKTEASQALLLLHKSKKIINLYVTGVLKSKMYSLITEELKKINNDLKLTRDDYIEKWACNCIQCSTSQNPYMINTRVLMRFVEKNKIYIDCLNSAESVKIEEILIGYKSNDLNKSLLREFIKASSRLQSNKKLLESYNENKINSFFQIILNQFLDEKLFTNEQSLKGVSESKKEQGELDISIESINGVSISFFEGMVLYSISKKNIENHIIKSIDQYDPNGLKEKFLGVYSKAVDFFSFSQKYLTYLNDTYSKIGDFNVKNHEDLSGVYIRGSEIKVYRTIYERGNSQLYLYHILINLF